MPVLDLPDASLHYEIGGSGPPLLMIAGMLSDSASWGPLVAPLEQHFTVIRPDNRTTGRTRHDREASVPQMADDAARLINALGLGPAHVVGHSLGGTIAIILSGIRPQGVRSLSLLATVPIPRPHLVSLFDGLTRIRRAAGSDWLRALYPWLFAPPFFETPRSVELAITTAEAYPHKQSVAAMAEQVRALAALEMSALPTTITMPATAILASEDPIASPALAEPALRALGVTRFRIVPGAGHSLHWDAPDATLTAVRAALEEMS